VDRDVDEMSISRIAGRWPGAVVVLCLALTFAWVGFLGWLLVSALLAVV
jgi:hypothetical protein